MNKLTKCSKMTIKEYLSQELAAQINVFKGILTIQLNHDQLAELCVSQSLKYNKKLDLMKALDCVINNCENLNVEEPIISQAFALIVQLFDKFLPPELLKEIVQRLNDLNQKLQNDIMTKKDEIANFDQQNRRKFILTCLTNGSQIYLSDFGLDIFNELIKIVIETSELFRNQEKFMFKELENIYFILEAIEITLMNWIEKSAILKKVTVKRNDNNNVRSNWILQCLEKTQKHDIIYKKLKIISESIEDAALHLSKRYSTYSYFICKIQTLLSKLIKIFQENNSKGFGLKTDSMQLH